LTAHMPRLSIRDPKVQWAIERRREKNASQENCRLVIVALRAHGESMLITLAELTGLSNAECAAALDSLRIRGSVESEDGVFRLAG
jgi:hypothetical protein